MEKIKLLILAILFTIGACEQNISTTSTGGDARPVVEIPETEINQEEKENEQTI